MLVGMSVTVCRLDGPVEFLSIGQFVSGPGWRHMRRTINSYELVFVRRGVLPLRVGERRMMLGEGEIALVPPGIEHAGTEAITANLDFYWMHMLLPSARTVGDGELPQDGRYLILPERRQAADPDRLAVLCNQLADLYARFGPHSNAYCDYCATSVLLEVSAQERFGALAVEHGVRLAGYRADGHAVLLNGIGPGAKPAERGKVAAAGIAASTAAGAGDGAGEHCASARSRIGLGPMLAVRSWIMANACDDITVANVAKRFHYSPSYLTALYKRVFGIGVGDQITECRIERARELLSSTSSPVSDIARESGYDDPKYFMRVFKRRTGLTPGQYRDAFPARLYNTV